MALAAGGGLLMAASAEFMAIAFAWTEIGWSHPEMKQTLASTKGNFTVNSFIRDECEATVLCGAIILSCGFQFRAEAIPEKY